MIQAALGLAKRGIPVFPIWGLRDGRCGCGGNCGRSAGKHPIPKRGLLDASMEAAVIQGWWQQHPDANIGMRTGVPFQGGRLLVVDIDHAKEGEVGGEAALQALPLPESLTVRTGSGGLHVWVRAPLDACPTIGSRFQAKGTTWAVDWRGRGGYVLAPPSRHVKGVYRWEHRAPIAEAPPELLALLKRDPPRMDWRPVRDVPLGQGRAAAYLQTALRGEVQALLTCPEGGRHRQLIKSAYKLAGYYRAGVDGEAIHAALLAAWSQAVGQREAEARKTITDGWNEGLKSPRPLPGEG